VVTTRQEAPSPFNFNNELYRFLSDVAVSPPRQAVMIDPSESEPSTQLNASSGGWLTDGLVEFPPVSPKDLIRLGEDLLHVCPIYNAIDYHSWRDDEDLPPISALITRGKASPAGLSSEDAAALTEIFRKVSHPRQIPSQYLTPLVVRPYPDGRTWISIRTRGPDF